jgi:hypothetical protein
MNLAFREMENLLTASFLSRCFPVSFGIPVSESIVSSGQKASARFENIHS